ncbi:hypothetical protein WNX29_10700, partial [Limosilactobacillus reuteri]|uniref:hypothetical protein n=1 Tax=Limosilactobacillus reuteri TaxID=1598 RepID=UPI0030E9D3AE
PFNDTDDHGLDNVKHNNPPILNVNSIQGFARLATFNSEFIVILRNSATFLGGKKSPTTKQNRSWG